MQGEREGIIINQIFAWYDGSDGKAVGSELKGPRFMSWLRQEKGKILHLVSVGCYFFAYVRGNK